MSIMRHLPQFLFDDPLSNQYSFSLSRRLEGTLDRGPGLGVWAVTDMRVQFGWGVPNRSAVGDLDLARRWPPVIPPGAEEAGRTNRICTYRKIKSAAECAQFTKRLATHPNCIRQPMCFSTAGRDMLPLYRDPYFTFRFAENRLVDRFHLDGVEPGTPVSVFALDPATGERREPIAEAVAGDGGWVNLPEPLVVRAGSGFVAVVQPPR